jgi:hypothetical protein
MGIGNENYSKGLVSCQNSVNKEKEGIPINAPSIGLIQF